MFESTLPFGEPDLMRVSAFRRYLDELDRQPARGPDAQASTRLSSLSPSLVADLLRFEQGGRTTDLLEVLAAAVRHARSLLVHLRRGNRVLPLTVFPRERLLHCPLRIDVLLDGLLDELEVLHVEPALLVPPGHDEPLLLAEAELCSPLAPFLWEMALRGSRDDLLPEIAGSAAYRISPGTDLRGLPIGGTLAAAVHRLRRQTTSLREISEWAGFDRSRAQRLLNALYLQTGLMVSRSHPAATQEGWFGPGR